MNEVLSGHLDMYIYDRRFVVVLVFVFCKFAIVNLYLYICVYKFVFEYLYVDICICIFVFVYLCKSCYCSVVCPNLRCGPIWISPLLGTSRRHRYIFPLSQILSFLILRLLDMASLRCMAPGTFAPQILIFQLLAMVW